MTVIAEHDLISEYTLFDPVIRERLDNFDTDSTCWDEYDFLGEGGEREAWLDKTTNLVYKRLHTDSRTLFMSHTDLFQEIPSLDKAHRFLREHPEHGVRYAETYYYTQAVHGSGVRGQPRRPYSHSVFLRCSHGHRLGYGHLRRLV